MKDSGARTVIDLEKEGFKMGLLLLSRCHPQILLEGRGLEGVFGFKIVSVCRCI